MNLFLTAYERIETVAGSTTRLKLLLISGFVYVESMAIVDLASRMAILLAHDIHYVTRYFTSADWCRA